MGFSFKKLTRGVKKIVKKNQGGVKRLVKKVGPGLAMAAVGATAPALVLKAASAAKTLGKKSRGLETPKSLAPVIRAAEVKVGKKRSKMPGGAPMPHVPQLKVRSLTSSTPQAKRSLYGGKTRKAKAPKAPKAPKVKRKSTKPPTAKQLAARERFKAMVAAKRKAA